jgi:F0F1-type ATP synthase assembly protein I
MPYDEVLLSCRSSPPAMSWIVVKYLLTALVVVLVSEAAARSDRLGGLVAALPLVTVLTLIWLHVERQPQEKIANHAWYTLWYVLPTLPMFGAFPWLLERFGFWPALGIGVVLTVASVVLFALALKPFGIRLL